MTTMRTARQRLTRFGMMAIVGALTLGVAAVTAGESVSAAASEEAMPDEDDRLTGPELRWCLFESVRLDGQREALDLRRVWEIEGYTSQSATYNESCSHRNYDERDRTVVEQEITSDKRAALWEQGASRVEQARAEREARRVHVEAEVAAVKAAPEESAGELGRVPQWGDLIETGRVEGSWHEVEWPPPAPGEAPTLGWILGDLVESGPGVEARFNYCEDHAGGGARHNDVVRQDIDLDGRGWLVVDNAAADDAYIKLIGEADDVVLSVFVAAGQTALVESIPTGSYEIAFATGSQFSRGCDSFARREAARKFAERIEYDRRTAGWTIGLSRAGAEHARTSSMNYDEFDRL